MQHRQLFQQYLAPTSTEPMALTITKAEGALLFGANGNQYVDLIGGISVCNVGHRHPKVVAAIKDQVDKYLHIMVYGEVVQSPQVLYAECLVKHLPQSLNSVYFTNSGAEAVEGAMKLAKRATGRAEIIAARNSYHGSTQGALSILGDEYWRNAYRPLLPGIRHINYNDFETIELITEKTACIILETIQAEAGVLQPHTDWIQAVRERCTATGTLLVLDEIQVGFGRTGRLWGFQHYGIVPDILLLGKALGGGMPLGAFIANQSLMQLLASNPILGHITTFGGHPVSCAAGKAAMEALIDEQMMDMVAEKEALFLATLQHEKIKAIRSKGLIMAVELSSFDEVKAVIDYCTLQPDKTGENGVFTDWFLFAANCIRIVPPLTISKAQIEEACMLLMKAMDRL